MKGSPATLLLSLAAVAAVELYFVAIMRTMWQRRAELLVRARTPSLALVQGACVVVFFAAITIQVCNVL